MSKVHTMVGAFTCLHVLTKIFFVSNFFSHQNKSKTMADKIAQLEDKAKQASTKVDELAKSVASLQIDQSNEFLAGIHEDLKLLRDTMAKEEKAVDTVIVERDKVRQGISKF